MHNIDLFPLHRSQLDHELCLMPLIVTKVILIETFVKQVLYVICMQGKNCLPARTIQHRTSRQTVCLFDRHWLFMMNLVPRSDLICNSSCPAAQPDLTISIFLHIHGIPLGQVVPANWDCKARHADMLEGTLTGSQYLTGCVLLALHQTDEMFVLGTGTQLAVQPRAQAVHGGLPGDRLPGNHLPGDHLPGNHLPGDHLPGNHLPGDHLRGPQH